MKPQKLSAAPLAMLLSGFVLWSAVFVVLYAIQATGCRLGWQYIDLFGPLTLQRAVLVLLFLGALVMHAVLYWMLRKARAKASTNGNGSNIFSTEAGSILAAAALGASLFCFSGVFWLSAC